MAETTKKKILVVDDEIYNRQLLVRVLRMKYELFEAEDAEEALELLRSESDSISLVLCDHHMPGMLGAELAEVIHQRWPKIAVMLLTGNDQDAAVRAVLAEGQIRAVVAKPWLRHELDEKISDILASL